MFARLRIAAILLAGLPSLAYAQTRPWSRPTPWGRATSQPSSRATSRPAGLPWTVQYAGTLRRYKDMGLTPAGPPVPESRATWFSPGAKSCAYAHAVGNGMLMIVNGKPVGPYAEIVYGEGAIWSEDGSTLAMTVRKEAGNEKPLTLIVNGREVATDRWVRPRVLSRDGKRCIYSTPDGLYLDQKKVARFQRPGDFGFGPDGKLAVCVGAERMQGDYDAYVNGEKTDLHLPGDPGLSQADSGALAFSPDGKHWALLGSEKDGTETVFLDRKVYAKAKGIRYGSLRFTPDSQGLIYVAQVGEEGYAVYRDGKPGKTWVSIDPESLRFLKGSGKLAFTANVHLRTDRDMRDIPGGPASVIDDQRVASSAAWAVTEDARHILSEEGSGDKQPNGARIYRIMLDGKEQFRVTEDVAWVTLRFSPDGQHWAATVLLRALQPSKLIVDGVARDFPACYGVRELEIDNTGGVTAVISKGDAVWTLTTATRP